MYLFVVVAPAFNAALALCEVAGPPRTVQVMERNQFVLYVGACPHLEGAANEDAHLTGAHLGKQFLLLHIRLGLMDKGHLIGRHPPGDELLPYVLIDSERLFRFQGNGVFQHMQQGIIQLVPGSFRRPLGRGGFWRGNIAENQLGQLFIVSIPPLL